MTWTSSHGPALEASPLSPQAMPPVLINDFAAAPLSVPDTVRTALPCGILARLRSETRDAHNATEISLGLASESLSHTGYARCLARFFGFYHPLEAALHQHALRQPFDRLLAGRLDKTGYLTQDLRALGVRSAALALCSALPPLHTPAEVYGCLYVVEGATLGGRVIGPQLQARLGIDAGSGGRFFSGYGEATGAMWQALRRALVCAAPDLATENRIIASANATFLALRVWCEEEISDE